MRSWAEQTLETLRPQYPDWDIWIVPMVYNRTTVWCAKPVGTPVATINAGSPEALIAAIREQSQGSKP